MGKNKYLISKFLRKAIRNKSGFSLVELVITIGMISTLSGLVVPSFLNWVRVERVNSYTRQVKEYFRIVRLEARRWGASCFINVNPISYDSLVRGEDSDGFTISCKYSTDPDSSDNSKSKIGTLVPKINNNVFQVVNNNFQITPNGRISSDKTIVIVIGSRYHIRGPKILNCLVIKSPTGHISKGYFSINDWISNNMAISEIYDDIYYDSILIPSYCKSSL